jgi:hypothetical protein
VQKEASLLARGLTLMAQFSKFRTAMGRLELNVFDEIRQFVLYLTQKDFAEA